MRVVASGSAVSATPAIRVRHLSHRFGAFDVLRDVSFEVGQGENLGFIAPMALARPPPSA